MSVDRDRSERRVYVLPADLLDRLRSYQSATGISSEVEAVRRLLDTALQIRDSVGTILDVLRARFSEEKDLRVLAKEILTGHILVQSVRFSQNDLEFTLSDGEIGRIDNKGRTFIAEQESDVWSEYPRREVQNKSNLSWDRTKKSNLDDDIPF